MPISAADRQAAYRKRQKARAAEPAEAMVERVRQAQFADWIAQTEADDNPEAVTLLRAVAARPTRTGEAFMDWLTGLLNHDIEEEVAVARKEASRAKRRRPRPA